ncbi:MAG: Xaa-Pro peptidase family protein [Actinomycetota bacterium]
MSHPERLARAAGDLASSGLDAMIVAPSPDLSWLIGYDPPPLERLTALVVRPGTDPVLVVPELERALAADATAGSPTDLIGWRDGEDPYEIVADLTGGASRVALADRTWASHTLALQRAVPTARFEATSEALPSLRAIKDDAEVDELASAGHGADTAFSAIVREPFAGRTERQIAAGLAHLLREHGHREVTFTIVGSGPNGASPHHEATDRVIGPGDAVVLDFGGRVPAGYCSDITRTVHVGEASADVAEVHAIVLAAQQAAFDAAGPGVPAEDVDRAARAVIESAGYGERFVHRTGHGIGLEEHEPPYIVSGNATPLQAGMCFSIEPGVYLENRFGVRIEDIVVVTDDGARRLNKAPRELLRVD